MSENDRAVTERDETGLVKLVVKGNRVVGAGILSLGPLQLAQLLISLQVPNANSLGARFRTVAAFLRFFLAQLWVLYVRKGA